MSVTQKNIPEIFLNIRKGLLLNNATIDHESSSEATASRLFVRMKGF